MDNAFLFPTYPFYVMLKPVGASCNMACRYCYYLEKSKLYPQAGRHVMSESLLLRFIQQYIGAQTNREVLFTWHGGEAMMLPLSFYEKALEMQRQYAGGHIISNCIQTNGTLLTDDWCRFLKKNDWLVGLSIDGLREFHDPYRLFRDGMPSWDRVMRAVDMLNRHGVEWNAMAVVNDLVAAHPLEFYHFFKNIGCHFLQFTPVVERLTGPSDNRRLASVSDVEATEMAPFSVTPEAWGNFLCTIFDEWVRKDVGEWYVQLFDATLANWCGVTPGVCSMAGNCGHAAVMEWNGDVYSCDHFVFPSYRLGNIMSVPLVDLVYGEKQREFSRMKASSLPSQCKECPFLFACHGECPKNRFAQTSTGQPGLNYLCAGYRTFFDHAAPYMDFMAHEYREGRPPANIMQALRQGLVL